MIWLPLLASARTTSISNETVGSYILENSDKMVINSSGKSAFICFQAHYIPGDINMTIDSDTAESFVISPEAGSRYSFSNVTITISYSGTACKIVLYILNQSDCPSRNIYSRSQRSANINASDYYVSLPICYFFDFEFKPTLIFSASDSNTAPVSWSYTADNGSFVSVTSAPQTLPRLFYIRFGYGNLKLLNITINGTWAVADWTESPSKFSVCTSSSDCSTTYFENWRLTTEHSVKPWVWGTLFGSIGLVFVLIVIAIFLPPKAINKVANVVPAENKEA